MEKPKKEPSRHMFGQVEFGGEGEDEDGLGEMDDSSESLCSDDEEEDMCSAPGEDLCVCDESGNEFDDNMELDVDENELQFDNVAEKVAEEEMKAALGPVKKDEQIYRRGFFIGDGTGSACVANMFQYNFAWFDVFDYHCIT